MVDEKEHASDGYSVTLTELPLTFCIQGMKQGVFPLFCKVKETSLSSNYYQR